MAFRSYTLTLNGAAQRLSDVYASAAAGSVTAMADIPYRLVTLQGLLANTGNIFVGMDNTVSSTNHAFRINAVDGDQPIILAPPSPGGPTKLSDFWVIGTNAEVLCVGGVPL